MIKKIMFILACALLLIGCQQTIKIGYSSGTTGDLSQIGIDGRNAFLIKVKEINESGGINGKMIETLVLDDENDPNKIKQVHDEFESSDYQLIVGHIMSSLDQALLLEAKKDKLIISASISSANMDGIDDNFIRLSASFKGQVLKTVETLEADGVKRLSVVYDMRNSAYSKGFYTMLKSEIDSIINAYPFGMDSNISEKDIVQMIKEDQADGILMITPAGVTGELCKNIELEGMAIKKYGVSWSMSPELFEAGGETVEGMKIVYIDQKAKYKDAYNAFLEAFLDEYAYEPSSIAFNTYESTSILIEAIQKTKSIDVDNLKKYITNRTFIGLSDDIIINTYGDREETFVMFEVINDEFIQID